MICVQNYTENNMSYPHVESGTKAAATGMSLGGLTLGFMLLRQVGGEQFDYIMRAGLIGSLVVYIPAFLYQITKSVREFRKFEKQLSKF